MTDEPYSPDAANKKRIKDYRTVFGSELGQKILTDLCRKYKLLKPTTINEVQGSSPNAMWWVAGTHAVLNDILEKLNENPIKLKQKMVSNDERRNTGN